MNRIIELVSDLFVSIAIAVYAVVVVGIVCLFAVGVVKALFEIGMFVFFISLGIFATVTGIILW